MNIVKFEASPYKGKIQELHNLGEELRRGAETKEDVTLDELVETKFSGITVDDLFESLGIDTSIDTISAIQTQSDFDVKWIIPEIFRTAIRTGLRSAPIWPQITSAEIKSTQLKLTMPYINMSDAAPRKVNEAETISVGSVSYGQKSVEVYKIGRGIKIPYEVLQYVSIDVVAIFLQDFGVKLGQALDTLAIDVLLNGDQKDGSASAPVIGVATPGSTVYRDFLRLWVRASRMGRNFNTIIGGEEAAIDTLDLPEFKTRTSGTTQAVLNLKTPVPNSADYFVHGNVPDNQQILIDKAFALIKMNVQPLLIETDKIISNQTIETYCTLTTGFAKLFLDAAVVMDSTVEFDGFPSYMDPDALQDVTIN